MFTTATNSSPTAVDGELQTASQLGSVPSTQEPSPQTLERRRRAVPMPSIGRTVKFKNTQHFNLIEVRELHVVRLLCSFK
jgi:hypothetical protein